MRCRRGEVREIWEVRETRGHKLVDVRAQAGNDVLFAHASV